MILDGKLRKGAAPCPSCGSVRADELTREVHDNAMVGAPTLPPWSVRVSDYESVTALHNEHEQRIAELEEKKKRGDDLFAVADIEINRLKRELRAALMQIEDLKQK